MQTITKRELNRNPGRVTQLKPGEAMAITDRQGRLTIRREKKVTLTPKEIEADLQRICVGCPPTDALAMMADEA